MHRDSANKDISVAIPFGDFTGGALCVECSARELASIDTHGRMAKVDGRFPHWVLPYEGERFFPIRQHWEKVASTRQAKRPCVLGEEGSGAKKKKARRR